MRTLILRFTAITALAIGALVLLAPAAEAQERCVPFGGTMFLWHTDNWYGVGDLSVGRKVMHADLVDINTSIVFGDYIWTGTEMATFDFGHGNRFQTPIEFIAEHVNDSVSASGVFHISEIGTLTKGTGMFKNTYGHYIMQGPFGPNVKLPDNIQPAPGADMFGIVQYHGTICGIKDSD